MANSPSTDYSVTTALPVSLIQRSQEIQELVEVGQLQARHNIARAQQRSRATQDDAAGASNIRNEPLQVGEVVFLSQPNYLRRKLQPRFIGPFKIIRVAQPTRGGRARNRANLSQSPDHSFSSSATMAQPQGPSCVFGNYLVRPGGSVLAKAYPLDQLLPVTDRAAAEDIWEQATSGVPSEELVYHVDHVLDHRTNSTGQREYRLRWKGFSTLFDSWEPTSVLLTPRILAEYYEGTSGSSSETLPDGRAMATPRRALSSGSVPEPLSVVTPAELRMVTGSAQSPRRSSIHTRVGQRHHPSTAGYPSLPVSASPVTVFGRLGRLLSRDTAAARPGGLVLRGFTDGASRSSAPPGSTPPAQTPLSVKGGRLGQELNLPYVHSSGHLSVTAMSGGIPGSSLHPRGSPKPMRSRREPGPLARRRR